MIKGIPYLYRVHSERQGKKVVQKVEKYLGRSNQEVENWEVLRSRIYIRDKGRCWICHKLVSIDNFELGHLIDRCNGGKSDYDNLAIMHKECNQSKPRHKTIDEHMKWLFENRLIKNAPFFNDDYFKQFDINESS